MGCMAPTCDVIPLSLSLFPSPHSSSMSTPPSLSQLRGQNLFDLSGVVAVVTGTLSLSLFFSRLMALTFGSAQVVHRGSDS